MKAKLSVTGVDANKVKLGQPVEIEFPSIQNKIYSGKVVRINEAFNPVTNSLEIEVRILNPDDRIKSGLFGKFNLELNRKENVNVVPEIAVQQQTEVIINKKTGVQEPVRKYFVFKIVDGKAKLSEVEVGITSNGRIEVTKGLEQNDQVVIVGQNIVKDGNSVKIIE
jgi:membrane fusion protein (multidrug efflux system)